MREKSQYVLVFLLIDVELLICSKPYSFSTSDRQNVKFWAEKFCI